MNADIGWLHNVPSGIWGNANVDEKISLIIMINWLVIIITTWDVSDSQAQTLLGFHNAYMYGENEMMSFTCPSNDGSHLPYTYITT